MYVWLFFIPWVVGGTLSFRKACYETDIDLGCVVLSHGSAASLKIRFASMWLQCEKFQIPYELLILNDCESNDYAIGSAWM